MSLFISSTMGNILIVKIKNRMILLSIIFILDIIFILHFHTKSVSHAIHDGLSGVVLLQTFCILDILSNFKMSIFFLDSLGIYKKYREYKLLALIFLFSILQLEFYIVGSNDMGRLCTFPTVC